MHQHDEGKKYKLDGASSSIQTKTIHINLIKRERGCYNTLDLRYVTYTNNTFEDTHTHTWTAGERIESCTVLTKTPMTKEEEEEEKRQAQ